jgi:hypothetical protein
LSLALNLFDLTSASHPKFPLALTVAAGATNDQGVPPALPGVAVEV